MQRFLESQFLGNKACDLMDDKFLNVLPKDAQVYEHICTECDFTRC